MNNHNSEYALNVLRLFVASASNGQMPSNDVLSYMSTAIIEYLCQGSSIGDPGTKLKSLDQCFGLATIQKAGHPLERSAKTLERSVYLYHMWQLRNQARIQGNPISIENAADAVIRHHKLFREASVLKKAYIDKNCDTVYNDNPYFHFMPLMPDDINRLLLAHS